MLTAYERNVTIGFMNETASTTQILHADPEHGGIRMTVLLTIFLGLIGGFLLIRVLLGLFAQGSIFLEFATVISCIGAFPIAMGCAWLVENYLKKTWTSGLKIELSDQGLHFEAAENEAGLTESRDITFSKPLNLTNWYFKLKGYPKAGRERLVSDKWYCMANQIQQDGERLITYTYLPPEKAELWLGKKNFIEPFHQISLVQAYKESGARRWSAPNRPEISSELLAGADGRYWIAERRRWQEGLELTAEDFTALMDKIQQKAQTNFE
ncbi:MAG: hypothetical protein ACK2T4_13645 [Candidatus Promineifilaceae bacterium]